MRLKPLQWMICVGALLVAAPVGGAQSAHGWTVKPQWVQAHEEFLAGDAMQGRGSATRDEEVTATYVASEFLAYGLKTGAGDDGICPARGGGAAGAGWARNDPGGQHEPGGQHQDSRKAWTFIC